ncbi:MAG: serine hydrolase, partial [Herminiimonas sp.]|nr:serine hydrolase [Herminiimonas sp.]
YIVAGQVIAQKTGKSWGDAVRERLLAPLGMNMTTVTQAENAGNPNVASAHSKIDGQVGVVRTMPITAAAGAVGVNSNAEDLARWMSALMDGGRVAGAPSGGKDKELRIFSAAQGREMWSAQTPMKIADPKPALAALKPEFQAYGLGFNLRDYKGHKMVLHSGTVQGFKSRVIMIPDARLGVAILTNAESGGAITALEYRVLDQYLSVPPSDWIALVHGVDLQEEADDLAKQKKAGAARAAGSKPSLPLSAYDGQYRDAWYGTVSVILEGDKRVMRFSNSPDLTGQLEHFQYDTFIVRWNERNFNADAYVSFSLNADGSIERMKMAPVSSQTDFSFDFADLLFVPVPLASN